MPTAEQNASKQAMVERLIGLIHRFSPAQLEQVLQFMESIGIDTSEKSERQDARRPLSTPLTFYFGERLHRGQSRDISPGGMFIETDSRFHFAEKIVIELPNPPEGLPGKISALVVRITSEGIGVEFIEEEGRI